MPAKMSDLRSQLGVPDGAFRVAGLRYGSWPGPFRVAPAAPLFPRLVAVTDTVAATATDSKPEVSYEDFGKLDLRAGRVKHAERVPKSDKLLRLVVDIGEERQVVAGIGKRFAPEDLVGRRVVVVANLKPIKLMGVESRGMVLAAGGDADLELVSVPDGVAPGAKVK
jgi:methionyl-tRNA synthetase